MARETIRWAELKMIARAFGWRGRDSEKPPVIWAWLQNSNIAVEQVWAKKHELQKAIRGIAPTPGEPASNDQLNKLVDERMNERLQAFAGAKIDMAAVKRLVAEAVLDVEPRKIVLQEGKPPVKMTRRTHPVFEKVLRLVRAGLNVLLVGPAGCGKSHLALDVADALKREFGMMNCTAGASESQLTGWLLPIEKGGNFVYVASEFVRLFEDGNSVFLLDEIDACDPNMLLVINSALANGQMHIAVRHRKPEVLKGKNSAIIAAANTFGTGADAQYAGRNQLDAATLDRFYVVRMGFDETLEAEMFGGEVPAEQQWKPALPETLDADIKELGAWVHGLRRKVESQRLRRNVGTRMIQKAIAARKAGVAKEEIKRDMMAGWTRDELTKIGEASV